MHGDEVMEVKNKAEALDMSPLRLDDASWLMALGVQNPEEFSEVWLDDINQLASLANLQLTWTAEEERPAILEARAQFFEKVPIFPVGDIDGLKLANLPRPEVVISMARKLSEIGLPPNLIKKLPRIVFAEPGAIRDKLECLSDRGIEAAKAINAFPTILTYSLDSIQSKLDNLAEMGLDATKVVGHNPVSLGYSQEAVREKLTNLTSLDLNAVSIINTQPTILSYSPEAVRAKISNLQALGLHAAVIINKQPSLLSIAPETAVRKMRVLYSIGRLWGWPNYKEDVNNLVEQVPVLLASHSQKIRTLARIATLHFRPTSPYTTLDSDIRRTVMAPIVRNVVAHLEHGDNLVEPRDIRRIGKRYTTYPKSELRDIIAQHPNDPIVKSYLKQVR